jgi:hypothetical protein
VAPGLQDQAGSDPLAFCTSDPEELRPAFQAGDSGGHGLTLCGKALASLGAPLGENPAAANGRHAATESMPPLADESAWLKGSFHELTPREIQAPLYKVLPERSQRQRRRPRREAQSSRWANFSNPFRA